MVDKTEKTEKSWLDGINLTELIETTNMDIKPKYSLIPKDDFLTIRRVSIISLPITKDVVKNKGTKNEKTLSLSFMEISDNGIIYSLPANSMSLRRSIISCAITLSEIKDIKDLDLSVVLGKLLGIKREKFTAKGYDAQALKFFLLME